MLNRDSILAAQDSNYIDVEIPEWGGSVRLKGMSVIDQLKFEKMVSDKVAHQDMMMHVVLSCCVDEKDHKLFTADDAEALGKKCPSAVLKLFNEALKLNYISDAEVKKNAKNS